MFEVVDIRVDPTFILQGRRAHTKQISFCFNVGVTSVRRWCPFFSLVESYLVVSFTELQKELSLPLHHAVSLLPVYTLGLETTPLDWYIYLSDDIDLDLVCRPFKFILKQVGFTKCRNPLIPLYWWYRVVNWPFRLDLTFIFILFVMFGSCSILIIPPISEMVPLPQH